MKRLVNQRNPFRSCACRSLSTTPQAHLGVSNQDLRLRTIECLRSWDHSSKEERTVTTVHLTEKWLATNPHDENDARLITLLLRKMVARRGIDKRDDEKWQADAPVLLHRMLGWFRDSDTSQPGTVLSLFQTFRNLLQLAPSSYVLLFGYLSKDGLSLTDEDLTIVDEIAGDLYCSAKPESADTIIAQNSHLHFLATRSDVDVLRFFLSKMRTVDAWSFAAILRAHIQQDDVDQACQLLASEPIAGSSTVCFNLCLQAMAKKGTHVDAERLFWELLSNNENMQPSAYTYLALIQALKEYPERATGILEHMLQVSNLPPNVYCFTALMDAWARKRNSVAKVESLLESMQRDYGLEPSTATLTTVIRAWGNSTQLSIEAADRATEVFGHIVAPDSQTYAALLQAWSNSARARTDAPDKALEIFESMITKEVEPCVASFNIVLRAFARSQRALEAQSLLTNARLYSVRPNVASFTLVMSAFRGRKDSAQQIRQVFESLQHEYNLSNAECVRPTSTAVNEALLAHSNAEEAESFFWCVADTFPPELLSTTSCNILLRLWSQSINPVATKRSEDVLAIMKQQPYRHPTSETYRHLILAWRNSGLKAAERRVPELLALQSKTLLMHKNA